MSSTGTRAGPWLPRDLWQAVKGAIAQLFQHGLVLVLHLLLDDFIRVLRAVRAARSGQDGPFIEEMRSDPQSRQPRVFCLNVEQTSKVTDVVVVPKERRTL